MESPSLSWSPQEFARLFPFHLIVDAETCVRQLGPSLQRMLPDVDVGQPLSHYFRIKRPDIAIDYACIVENCQSLFLLEHLGKDVMLKGQMFPMDSGNMIAFLCSPWVTDLQQVRDWGISLTDFALHDPVSDYLLLLQAKDTSLAESTKLQEELRAHRETLERTVQQRTQQLRGEIAERRAVEEKLQASQTAALNITEDVQEARRTAEQAEAELRKSEKQSRDLVEHALYGIYRSTSEGRFESVNRALVEMLGYASHEELLRVHLADLYCDPDERIRLQEKYQGTEGMMGAEVHWKRRDGRPITVRLTGSKIRDARGEVTAYEVIAEDVTERRVLEEQLRQSQKLEAVGRLAGGVAHDFNNILTIVLGESAMALQNLPDHHPLRDTLQEIHDAGTRAESLTRQLLAFSRKQIVEPVVFDVNQLVMGMDKMLRRLIGEDIEFITRTASDPVMVTADRGQIEQVLLNLAVNARDAMPEGGELVIETGVLVLDEDYADSHTEVRAGDYALISVSDTGVGMTDEVKAQLFEPFFTTKGSEYGSGLGLAVCYGIVTQLGGHIGVYGEPGLGSTMKVYLPRATQPAEAFVETVAADPAHGDETILLVEDEGPVRKIGSSILRGYGYRVLEAASGEEALRLFDGAEEHVDLLLCDVVLPKMIGRVLADRVRVLRPAIKVMFVSGYTDDIILRNQLVERNVVLLQKPFTPLSLASKVREVLDA